MTSSQRSRRQGTGAELAPQADSRFVLATHEHPTATRSDRCVAMHGLLIALGKDAEMFIAPEDLPLPYEYRFFALDRTRSTSRPQTSPSAP